MPASSATASGAPLPSAGSGVAGAGRAGLGSGGLDGVVVDRSQEGARLARGGLEDAVQLIPHVARVGHAGTLEAVAERELDRPLGVDPDRVRGGRGSPAFAAKSSSSAGRYCWITSSGCP